MILLVSESSITTSKRNTKGKGKMKAIKIKGQWIASGANGAQGMDKSLTKAILIALAQQGVKS